MNNLYVAAFNDSEIYSCYLPFCSTNQSLVEQKCKEWEESYKQTGCSGNYFIKEFDISVGFLNVIDHALQYHCSITLYFKCNIKTIDSGYDYNYYQIEDIVDYSTEKEYQNQNFDSGICIFECKYIQE